MKVLLIGSGGVGGAIAAIAARRSFIELLVVADVDPVKAGGVAAGVAEASKQGMRCEAVGLDASNADAIVEVAKRFGVDAIVNACDPRFNPSIFEAAFQVGVTYLDMAMNLSTPHPTHPYELIGETLGVAQDAMHEQWVAKGQLALVGMGVEPGLSDVFARYARDHLFSRIDEIGVRDGSNLVIEGYDFAPTFSIWTTIEECLNPPIVYERGRGWFTTAPFSEPEAFTFPAGIGTIECVNVEHEEVLLIPRVIDVGRVTFKYGLGADFIEVLEMIHKLGLDTTKKIRVGDALVSPRDVVAASLPDPAKLGDRMTGKTCAGTWVKGLDTAGKPSELYLHHVVDNADTMREYNCQAVVWQTAINPVIALELLATGVWSGSGVLGPEAFDAVPFLQLLADYGSPHAVEYRTVVPAA
jgi:saccharopine dehydrogenase (NAD+, L-lysine forming)